MSLTKTFPRLWSLEAGAVMVVTDLHGDWPTYQRYRDRFVDLQAKGQIDYFILTGDVIHSETPEQPDRSVEIVLDLIALRKKYGQAVIYLCGNHELVHLYSLRLSKNGQEYTAAFEQALSRSGQRAEIMALFDGLPFFICTRSGVSLTHAGVSTPLVDRSSARQLFEWSHQDMRAWADGTLNNNNVEVLRQSYARQYQLPYSILAKHYLAVSDEADPRYDDLLRGKMINGRYEFKELLWPVLSSRCEEAYGQAGYGALLERTLDQLSTTTWTQHLLLAGHMPVRGGHQIVAQRHLRLASAYHATPPTAGQYLLFDAGQPINDMKTLRAGLENYIPDY